MFEEMTFENILKRTLNRVSDNLDKRQGSIIYDAVAPACAEMAQMYIELDNILKITFAETSYGEFLDKRVEEMGVKRKKATKAQRIAKFYGNNNKAYNINLGDRFSIEGLNYVATEKIDDGVFVLECEKAGIEGNQLFGSLIPIENINGLAKAEMIGNDSVKIAGENEENDSMLLERYRNSIIDKAQDGNVAQYKKWCQDEDGIGAYKILPLANGANTVKVLISGSNGRAASDELVRSFQNKLDPEKKGLGNGLAPIGAIVTIATGTEIYLPITCKIKLLDGYTEEEVYENIENKIAEFFKYIIYKKSTISYLQLVYVVSSSDGVDSLLELSINGRTVDIKIGDDKIPVLRSKKNGDTENDLTLIVEEGGL